MLFFYYGIPGFYTNVTAQVNAKCKNEDGTIVLPYTDIARASIFGDLIPSVVKEISIVDGSGDTLALHASNAARIPAGATSIAQIQVHDVNRERAEWWRDVGQHIVDPDAQLAELHARVTLCFGHKGEELPEQQLALQFIQPGDTVLELGGNIGRNSLTLAQILDDDTRLVVLESSPQYAWQLAVNRYLNGFRFHIESSALSATPLNQNGWVTSADTATGTPVNTVTLPELRARYGLKFTALVADCEGALYQILHDFPDLLDGIRTVVIENDFSTLEQKEYVDAAFRAAGLECALSLPGPSYAPAHVRGCLDRFFEAWVRP